MVSNYRVLKKKQDLRNVFPDLDNPTPASGVLNLNLFKKKKKKKTKPQRTWPSVNLPNKGQFSFQKEFSQEKKIPCVHIPGITGKNDTAFL